MRDHARLQHTHLVMEWPQARRLEQLPPLKEVLEALVPHMQLDLQLPKRQHALALADAPPCAATIRCRGGDPLHGKVADDAAESLPLPALDVQSQKVDVRVACGVRALMSMQQTPTRLGVN